MKKFLSLAILAAATLLSAVGCGDGPGLKGLEGAVGVITLDGQPLSEASITISPASGTGRSAGAMSDKDGKFVFQTLKANDGVAPGEYKVGVTKSHMENPYTEEETLLLQNSGGKRHKEVFPADRPEPTPVSDIPEYYGDPNASGLTLTIPEGGTKDLKLELTSEE